MAKLKINNVEYDAKFVGNNPDKFWDDRHSISITVNMDYQTTYNLFPNNVVWYVVENETEYDMSKFCLSGAITDNRNSTCTIKMGQKTELEKTKELLDDAETAAKILLGETE